MNLKATIYHWGFAVLFTIVSDGRKLGVIAKFIILLNTEMLCW